MISDFAESETRINRMSQNIILRRVFAIKRPGSFLRDSVTADTISSFVNNNDNNNH